MKVRRALCASMSSGEDGYSRQQTELRFVVFGHAGDYVTASSFRARRGISTRRRIVLIVGLIFALLTAPMVVGNFGSSR